MLSGCSVPGVEVSANRVKSLLFGSSRRETRLLGVLVCAFFAYLLFTSLAEGVGWDARARGCTLTPGFGYMNLDAFLYLPYALAGGNQCVAFLWGEGAPVTGLQRPLGYFAATPSLFAWTTAWWLFLSLGLARLSVAGISLLSRRSGGRLKPLLVGNSQGETWLLILLVYVFFAIFLVASLAKGIGWDRGGLNCVGITHAIDLNPFLYLPYALTDHSTCIHYGVTTFLRLPPDYLAYTPWFYGWTIAWWLFLSWVLARLAVAGASSPQFRRLIGARRTGQA